MKLKLADFQFEVKSFDCWQPDPTPIEIRTPPYDQPGQMLVGGIQLSFETPVPLAARAFFLDCMSQQPQPPLAFEMNQGGIKITGTAFVQSFNAEQITVEYLPPRDQGE